MAHDPDTWIGGRSARFPHTQHSAVFSLQSDDSTVRERAVSAIVSSYWKPVYKYVRLKWNKSNEDAKDLTQSFFAVAMEKNYFHSYAAGKGTFRTFLRACLDGFLNNQDQSLKRLKRGGSVLMVPLDFETAEGELQTIPVTDGQTTEDFFYREWVRHLFSTAVEQLRQECAEAGKLSHFLLLERYDLDQTASSYDELARAVGLPVSTITNQLAWARRQFRRIVLDRIREVSGSEREFQREARELLGVTPK